MKGVENNDLRRLYAILQYDAVGRKNFSVNGSIHDSLLHKAARNRNYEICRKLVKYGADVNLLNFENQSPLNVAEANCDFNICKLLVRKRKEWRIRYKRDLHNLVRHNDFFTVKSYLLKDEPGVNETDEMMRTPLHVATIFADDAVCDLLLKYGADVHAKDRNMDNPMQLAFYYGRFNLRERFLPVSYFG